MASKTSTLATRTDEFRASHAAAMRGNRSVALPLSGGGAVPISSGIFSAWIDRWSPLGGGNRRGLIRVARSLEEDHHFYQPVMGIRKRYHGAGFEVQDSGGEQRKTETRKWARLARDVWAEFLLSDSVTVIWLDGGTPAVMQGEDVDFENKFGQEKVTIRMERQKVSKTLRKAIGDSFANALEKDGKIVIENGRSGLLNCRVLTTAKDGSGFPMPSVKAAMMDLAIIELLKIGEWNGAFARRNLIRQAKKGHEIKNGNLAGQPMHFYKTAFGKQLLKFLSEKIGYSEFVGNFDLEFDYVFLPADFFDAKIYDAVHRRLMTWAGGAGLVAEAVDKTDDRFTNGLDMLRHEVLEPRRMVAAFLEEILSKCGVREAEVAFSNSIFFTVNQLQAYVSQAATNGHMSPQTAREWLGLDTAREANRMKAARKDPDGYMPPFEAKQGLVATGAVEPPTTSGGRPPASAE